MAHSLFRQSKIGKNITEKGKKIKFIEKRKIDNERKRKNSSMLSSTVTKTINQ